jgi:hypothetical protein
MSGSLRARPFGEWTKKVPTNFFPFSFRPVSQLDLEIAQSFGCGQQKALRIFAAFFGSFCLALFFVFLFVFTN